MCSIFGVESKQIPLETLRRHFDRTLSRGPDMSRLVEIPCGYLGFHRLAIMGPNENGMQPFERDGSYVVCNGELYGFRPLKKRLEEKYVFQSESDCELLLPLYREYGLDFLKTLDAEFALILYDASTGKLIAARDPIYQRLFPVLHHQYGARRGGNRHVGGGVKSRAGRGNLHKGIARGFCGPGQVPSTQYDAQRQYQGASAAQGMGKIAA